MTILKDFYCPECMTTTADVEVASCGVVTLTLPCARCERDTEHCAQVNGGLGKRYRFADWDVREVRQGIRLEESGACYSNPDTGDLDRSLPVTDLKTGERLQDAPRFSSEARAERREREYHRRDRREGRGKIVSTARATSARAAGKAGR